jgi:hypothetical protein
MVMRKVQVRSGCWEHRTNQGETLTVLSSLCSGPPKGWEGERKEDEKEGEEEDEDKEEEGPAVVTKNCNQKGKAKGKGKKVGVQGPFRKQ